jgi:hypothetical protein
MKRFGVVAAIVSAVATLSPGSTVLCVAPGGHVVIEDINSGCCMSHDSSSITSNQQGYGLNVPDNCGNCRDFPIVPDGCVVILESFHFAAPATPDIECFGTRIPELADGPSPELRECNNMDSLYPVCFSALLRC